MKIIIAGPAYPYRGGIAASNERLAQEFEAAGHEVEIYTFTLQYPSFLFPGKTQYSGGKAPDKLKIYRKINSINPLNWLAIGREIRKKQPEILIIRYWLPFMSPCFGTIARAVRKNGKTKAVSIVDNIFPHENRPGDKILSRYFVKSMDSFIAMSNSVLKDLEAFDKKKPKLFSPHPVYDHFGKPADRREALKELGLEKNKRYMLFFGFIRDYKGLDLLMRAYAVKGFEEKNVELIVAGEFYNNSEKYFKLEKELGLKGKIRWFNDFVPDDRVRYFFSAADIIVQPYITATQSGVTQIGYHFEKPMLVTNVGGLAEIVPDGKAGYVVKPEAEAVAEALLDFFENERKDTFKEGIKEEKKKYAWSYMMETVFEAASIEPPQK